MIRTRRTAVGRELERLLRDGVQSARSDARLLNRYIDDRDESAFEALVERHGPMVMSLCRRYLRDPRDVEDAFQATFMILIRKASSLRDRSTLSSWLYGVAYRVALRSRANVLKRRDREGEPGGLKEPVAPSPRPVDDSLEILDAELRRLPEKYRAPLVLCYLEGRTHDQAAVELGWPVGTVRSRMAAARATLAQRLTRRGLDASACLALLRPEHLITSTILPAITSTSTSWPATALAQGVLTAMFISQWKWLGVAATTVGLFAASAGVGALAVQEPGGPEGASQPLQESKPIEAPQTDKPAPKPDQPINTAVRSSRDDVQARLAEMERKIDRLTDLLQRMEKRYATSAAPSMPPLPPVPTASSEMLGTLPPPPGGPPSPVPSTTLNPSPVPSPSPNPSALPTPTVHPPSLQPGRAAYIEDSVPLLASPPARLDRPEGPPQLGPEPTPIQRPSPASSRIESPAPSSPSPGNARRSAPTASDLLPDLGGGGVRVIEAQLLSSYTKYKRYKKLVENKAVPAELLLEVTDRARILVAYLREMEDEIEFESRNVERLQQALERARKEAEVISENRNQPMRVELRARLEDQLNRSYHLVDSLNDALRAQQSDLEMKKIRLPKVQELIRWAEEHFKELKE